ncbi:MAG: lytic transglycosylase domain-containing protein [Lachnospiraceae bacterium]|nr:lytic transglycosylase domain-containing protein [Lachnospiraceae bacterium]
MISTESYLNAMNSLKVLKPVKTYPENSGRETTITGFDEMLQKVSGKKNETETRKAEKENTDNTEEADNTEENTGYKDPVTGRMVRYIDVADSGKDDAGKDGSKKTSGSSQAGQQTVMASSMKKTKYDAYFKAAAKKYNVSESLLKAIAKAESDFNPDCVSSAGAMGVMQLMPETAKGLGVDDPYDPEQNIMGGAKCISLKLKEFKGDVRLALAAYNAGSGAVRRNGGVPSYCTTYINKVLSYKEAFETANAVG